VCSACMMQYSKILGNSIALLQVAPTLDIKDMSGVGHGHNNI